MSATPEEIAKDLEETAKLVPVLRDYRPTHLGLRSVKTLITEAAALIRAQAERERVRVEAGEFLVDRLSDFERDGDVRTDDGERDWHGHIAPALSRFRKALKGEL